MNKFKTAAIVILAELGTPLHYREITRLALENGVVRLRFRCFNQHGKDVLQADVSGFPGKFA